MTDPFVVAAVTFGLIALSAFFVAVEFAVIAAKKYRLEDAAAHSRSARAALRNASELTLLLAGSQLGITVCTLALGAVSKPAVHHWLTPAITSWGLATWLADAVAFALALLVVTFLHLVVGEMAPKSWAIAHAERAAVVLALPMRAFMAVTRPTLRLLNSAADRCLRLVRVEPTDEVATGQDRHALRQLVTHSGEAGSLDPAHSEAITTALDLDSTTVAELIRDGAVSSVPAGATVGDVQDAARVSGHLRIVVDGESAVAPGVIHVRDTLGRPDGASIADLVSPAHRLAADMSLHSALRDMQAAGAQLAVVVDDSGRRGVVTVTDVLSRLLPSANGSLTS